MTTDTPSGVARTYAVPGISCDHCKNAIESQLVPLDDVDDVVVDVEAKTVTVTGGNDDTIRSAITAAGYAVG